MNDSRNFTTDELLLLSDILTDYLGCLDDIMDVFPNDSKEYLMSLNKSLIIRRFISNHKIPMSVDMSFGIH